MIRLLSLPFFFASSSCTSGECTGSVFGEAKDGARLTSDSHSHQIQPDDCIGLPVQVLVLDWDEQISAIIALETPINALDGQAKIALMPPELRSERVLGFELRQGTPSVANLAIEFDVGSHWRGTLAMRDSDDDVAKCIFGVFSDDAKDEGPACESSSGGGDSDFDTD